MCLNYMTPWLNNFTDITTFHRDEAIDPKKAKHAIIRMLIDVTSIDREVRSCLFSLVLILSDVSFTASHDVEITR